MASTYSFDIVSDFDQQELVNALDQTRRELKSRYDLKDTNSTIEQKGETLEIETKDSMTLKSVREMMFQKAAKRGLDLKMFDYGPTGTASGGRVTQTINLVKGIDKELAKKISKTIRDEMKKVQASIQGDAVRVSAKSKDDLQTAMQLIRSGDWPVPLQFNNYR